MLNLRYNYILLYMKRIFTSAALLSAASLAMAGGLNTNTNQNAAFLRQLSQESIIDITGLNMNPAGTAFLAQGSHLSINIQNAKQSRDITTTFPLFAYRDGNSTHKFEGDAYAPVIPSIQYSYNWEKWSVNMNFALCGGGGKCEFDKGLGSFEALYAGNMCSSVASTLAQVNGAYGTDLKFAGYSLNAYMKGKQYYFGLTLGTTYKVLDNLSVSAGLKGIYALCNYNGWVNDLSVVTASELAAVSPQVAAVKQQVDGQIAQNLSGSTLELNSDQTGLGFAPIIGVDWKMNDQWNFAAKYEFKTRIRLENKSEMNAYAAAAAATNPVLGQFADGTKIAADMPSFFAVGAQYSPLKELRIQAGYHLYGDKNATQYGNKQDLIDNNTWEITAGIEYDICKYLTASCGWQTTQYGLSDAYMNDLSFTTSSNSYGLGVRVAVTEHCNIDLGFMQTLYDKREVTVQSLAGPKTDVYERTNRVLGIGFNLAF